MENNNYIRFNRILVESTGSRTDLCDLGAHHVTDKSPYTVGAVSNLKHPYTPVYDFLFSSLRHREINVGEVGIEKNASMRCWRDYFSKARLWGWEYHLDKISAALADDLENTEYLFMDVRDEESIQEQFAKAGVLFDIIIEDSTHVFEDQIRVTKQVHKFLAPGGFFVIEDVFRQRSLADYQEALADVLQYYTSVTVVDADHANKVPAHIDDNRLIVMVRNNK
jgi:SAM-dependent methyltransferase